MPKPLMEALTKYHKLPLNILVPLAFEGWRQRWEDDKASCLAGSSLHYLNSWKPCEVPAVPNPHTFQLHPKIFPDVGPYSLKQSAKE